jgi:hypothetical protein
MKPTELLSILDFCNEDLDESSVSLHTNGYVNNIVLDEFVLWSDQDDERNFNEELNEYEPLKDFVVKRLHKHIEFLSVVVENIEKRLVR